jgi:hypothetical protein
MAYSRGASALEAAVALGEIDGKAGDQCILRDFELFSSVASTSAGIELMHNVAIVLGNSASSASPFEIGHAVMRDAIDSAAVIDALKSVGKSAALLRPEMIEAFGKRIRYFNTFGGNPASCAVAHAVLKVIKAGRRLVLISATGNEGQILKIRPPLVFSSKDAKLFLATLDEVLTALWRTPPAGLPVQARGRWDQGRLIEPTRSVSAPFAALSTTLSGESTAHGQWQRSFDCRVRC